MLVGVAILRFHARHRTLHYRAPSGRESSVGAQSAAQARARSSVRSRFVERDVHHDGIRNRNKTQAGNLGEKFRFVYPTCVESVDVRSTAGDRWDDSGPRTRPLSMETEETGLSAGVSCERQQAAVECRLVDDQ